MFYKLTSKHTVFTIVGTVNFKCNVMFVNTSHRFVYGFHHTFTLKHFYWSNSSLTSFSHTVLLRILEFPNVKSCLNLKMTLFLPMSQVCTFLFKFSFNVFILIKCYGAAFDKDSRWSLTYYVISLRHNK